MATGNHPLVDRLGRIKSPFDPRDHDHLVASSREPIATAKATRKYRHRNNPRGFSWDQGPTPRCTSYGIHRLFVADPIRNAIFHDVQPEEGFNEDSPFHLALRDFYHQIQSRDGFPMPHDGSSVRATMEAAKAFGSIESYEWADSVTAGALHVLNTSPLCLGIDWTTTMFDPVQTGAKEFWINVLDQSGNYNVEGGHFLIWLGVDIRDKCPDGSTGSATLFNSWGRAWGYEGEVRISLKQLGILKQEGGEIARPVEVRNRHPAQM